MSQATFFVHRCPTCGRQLQVRIEYLGRELTCEHCHGKFVAAEEPVDNGDSAIIKRAEELIASVERDRQ